MSDELMQRARELLALREKATPGPWRSNGSSIWADHCIAVNATISENSCLIAAAHDMADTIAALMARAEELETIESALSDAHVEIHGHRFACSQAVAHYVKLINDARIAAESRLRELEMDDSKGIIGYDY